jgi:hypothetical protein
MANNPFARSALGRNTCICPHKNNDRNPRPAKAKEECPDGKLRQPSCRMWLSVSVHTVKSTSSWFAVPDRGLHRESRSGRGLPTAFLITSVTKDVRISLIDVRNRKEPFCGARTQ